MDAQSKIGIVTTIVWFQEKIILLPWEVIGNSEGKQKRLKKNMKLYWNSQIGGGGGVGVKPKSL